MITVFVDEQGKVLFTYPDVDVRSGDFVRYEGKTYLAARKTFDVQGGFYEVLLQMRSL